MPTQHWVFAYGSLIWDPGFEVAEHALARLDGYARHFCLRSVEHRGTRDHPGLVLGLDPTPGSWCEGLALRVSDHIWPRTLADLRMRELITGAYIEKQVPLDLRDGRHVEAVTYVMRTDHWQYAGGLAAHEQARIIASANGGRGPNSDYLFNTTRHLARIGLPDPALEVLSDQVRALIAAR